MERTKVIAEKLADLAGLSADEKADVARAADIYKFDLLTGMVGEFDELQGIMGEKYALLAGEKPAVAQLSVSTIFLTLQRANCLKARLVRSWHWLTNSIPFYPSSQLA